MSAMEEDDFGENPQLVCLKHSAHWRSRFQNLLNLIRGSPINKDIIDRFGKLICVCDPQQRIVDGSISSMSSIGDPSQWSRVTETEYQAAETYFEEFINKQDHYSERYSHLQFHYKSMRDSNLLSDGDTSAKRFLYLFYRIDKFKDLTFLKPLRPVSTQGHPKFEFEIPLAKLTEEQIGLFIGRRGRRLKYVLKEYKSVKATVSKNAGRIVANVSCRPEDKNEIIKTLTDAEDLLVERRKAHEERVKEYHEQQQSAVSMDT